MLMPSTQRWAANPCCRRIPHVLAIRHQLTSASFIHPGVCFDPIVLGGRYLWYKVLYFADSFVYMAIYDLEVKLVLSFGLILHPCNDFFVFLVEISRLYVLLVSEQAPRRSFNKIYVLILTNSLSSYCLCMHFHPVSLHHLNAAKPSVGIGC